LSDCQENWKGIIITDELIHFMSKGYRHEQQPGGFHVFMARSRRDTFPQNTEHRSRKRKLRGERKEKAAKQKLLQTKLRQIQIQKQSRRKLTIEPETKKRKKTEDDGPS